MLFTRMTLYCLLFDVLEAYAISMTKKYKLYILDINTNKIIIIIVIII